MAETWKVDIEGRVFGQMTSNTFYYELLTAPTGVRELALFNGIMTFAIPGGSGAAFYNRYVGALTSDWTPEVMSLNRINSNPLQRRQLIADISAQLAGALVPPTLPPQVAVVVRRSHPLALRRARGRIFLPAVRQAGVENGRVKTTLPADPLWTALNDLVLAIPASITGVEGGNSMTFRPVLLGHTLDPFTGDPSDNLAVTTSGFDEITRDQRRRQLGVGA